jgi:hypothetical protein
VFDGDIERLLARAREHEQPRVRRDAQKIAALVDALREVLAEEERVAAAKERIAKLESELARERARLTGGKPARPAGGAWVSLGPLSKRIRAWARENNVACPEHGRVPRAVVQAYESAQGAR